MTEETAQGGTESPLDKAAKDGPLSGVAELDALENAGDDDSPVDDSETVSDEYGRGVRPGGLTAH